MGGQMSQAEKDFVIVANAIIREINRRRSLINLLNSIKFRRIWNHSTEKEREYLIQDLEIRSVEYVNMR